MQCTALSKYRLLCTFFPMAKADTIDLAVERRITALETQMIEVNRMFTQIKQDTSNIDSKIAGALTNTTQLEQRLMGIEREANDCKIDRQAIHKQLDELDTVTFFTRNPRLLLYVAIGAIVFLVPGIRQIVARLILGTDM